MSKKIVVILLMAVTALPLYAQTDTTGTPADKKDQSAFSGAEIVVTEKKIHPGVVSVIKGEEVKKSTATDLINLINEKVPSFYTPERGVMGFGVASNGAGRMTIRGMGLSSWSLTAPTSPTHGLPILINGVDTTMGIMGHPVADVFAMKNVEHIEVLHGPQPVLYGASAVGGVINVITKRQEKEGFETEITASYGTFNTTDDSLVHRGKIGGFDYAISYNFRHTDGHREQRINNTTFTARYQDHNATAHLGYEFGKHIYASLDGYAMQMTAHDPGGVDSALDGEEYPYPSDRLEVFRIDRNGGLFSIRNSFNMLDGSLIAYANSGHHRSWMPAYDEEENKNLAAYKAKSNSTFKSNDVSYGVKLKETLKNVIPGNRITAGFDIRQVGGTAVNPQKYEGNPQRRQIDDNRYVQYDPYYYVKNKYITQQSYFGLVEQGLFENIIVLTAGARHTWDSASGDFDAWQGGVIVNPHKTTKVHASGAKGFILPEIRELYFKFAAQDNTIQETGFALKPETYYIYEAGIEQTITDFTLALTGYRIFSYNKWYKKTLLASDPYPKNPTGPAMKGSAWDNMEKFYYSGLEASAGYKYEKMLDVSVGYSYIDNEWNNQVLPYVPTHKVVANIGLTIADFFAGVSGEYIKELYWENPVPDDAANQSQTDKYGDTCGNRWRKEIPAYYVINAKLAYTFMKNYRAFVNLYNITNQRYTAMVVKANVGTDASPNYRGFDYPMPGFHFLAGLSATF